MRSSRRLPAYVVCPPGLERLTAAELAGLGIDRRRDPAAGTTPGGLEVSLTARQLYAANLHLRTATRVIVRVARFEAASFAAFEEEAGRTDWSAYLVPGLPVRARVTATKSRLWHTGAVAERLLRAMGREGDLGVRAGRAPGDDPPPFADPADTRGDPEDEYDEGRQLVIVRLVHDRVTISIDSSGEPLHRRGWRRQTAKAPLRPTLAAGMILAAGWDGTGPLLDPFCGSGTIPIEAARLARRIPSGLNRTFRFQDWPSFQPGTWASVIGPARAAVLDACPVPVIARDRDAGAVAATRGNAERAGVAADIDAAVAPVSELDAPTGPDRAHPDGTATGWLLTNPPYGRRIRGGADVRDLYARLGQVATARLSGWGVGMLVDDLAVARHTRLALTEAWRSRNGGLDVRFLTTTPHR